MNVKKIFSMALMLFLSIGLIGITPVSAASSSQTSHSGTTQTYLILYNTQSVPNNAATKIAAAGGTLVYSYDAIGVVVARSSNSRPERSKPQYRFTSLGFNWALV